MPQQVPHSPKLISPLCYGNTGVFQLWRDTKNVLSLFQTHSLKHTPSRILLPACTSVCKHIPLATDPRPSCYHGNRSPSPWRLLPPPHGSAQAKDLQVTSPAFSFLLSFSFIFTSLGFVLQFSPHLFKSASSAPLARFLSSFHMFLSCFFCLVTFN